MASKYMDDYRTNCKKERDNDITELKYAAEKNKNSLKSEKLNIANKSYGSGMVVFIIVGFLLSGFLQQVIGNIGFIIGPILGVVINLIRIAYINSNKDKARQNLDLQIQQVDKDLDLAIEKINCSCEEKIEEEKQNYLSRVKNARLSYGRSANLNAMIVYVANLAEQKILAADRAPYNKEILAEQCFMLTNSELWILNRFSPDSPNSNVIAKKEFREFYIYNVNDFYDLVGLAQALAKRVEFELLKRFPYDPVLPSKINKPKIAIDYNDTQIKLLYHVYNPQYRAAVNAKLY